MSISPPSGFLRISASAGSGKTYTLTRLFLLRALASPFAFQGIFAITFTNKAANELRERILLQLHSLTNLDPDAGISDLLGFPSAIALRDQARKIFPILLHDFDQLHVTTIDSFFQDLFGLLAFEAQLPPGLQTEVDIKAVGNEVLEEALARMGPEEIRILTENLMDRLMEKGKGWRTEEYLRSNPLKDVFNSRVVAFQLSDKADLLSEEALLSARKHLETYVGDLKSDLSIAAKTVLDFLISMGAGPGSEAYHEYKMYRNQVDFFQDLVDKKNVEKVYTYHARGQLFQSKNALSKENHALLEPILIQFSEIVTDSVLENLKLAQSLVQHVSSARLLLFFRQVLLDQNRLRNRVLLHEIKYVLQGIIGESDVPFLFEKMGSRIHTMLIDEFQDTDAVQWKVLVPLAKNIADEGGLCAFVGDVKQSIYGWRGAESDLFKQRMDQFLLPHSIENQFLGTNYRSEARIVEFNNWLFGILPKTYPRAIQAGGGLLDERPWEEMMVRNYEDQIQNLHPDANLRQAGFVECRLRRKGLIDNESENEEDAVESTGNYDWLIEDVRQLQDKGFTSNDIAILVRTNKEVDEIIQCLDLERQKHVPGYDFRYSASRNLLVGTQPLFRFLMEGFHVAFGIEDVDFSCRHMEALAVTLGLDPMFQASEPGETPDWREAWKFQPVHEQKDVLETFRWMVQFFKLSDVPGIQADLVAFHQLIFQFVQRDALSFTDFFDWWKKKASLGTYNPVAENTGIRVLTIHKSKGLDFNVVILPLSTKPDGLHKGDFWVSGPPPWDGFPLWKTQSKKALLKTDLRGDYQDQVFQKAVENLNTMYVACTRAVQGLILDIQYTCKEEELNIKKEPLPALLGFELIHAFQNETMPFGEGNTLDGGPGSLFFSFKSGQRNRLDLHKEIPQDGLMIPTYRLPTELNIPWAGLSEVKDAETEIGNLVHKVLENTLFEEDWRSVLDKISRSEDWESAQSKEVEGHLSQLFGIPQVKKWFSGIYSHRSEMKMRCANGKLLRADRVLLLPDSAFILDFKTGEEREEHIFQMQEYRSTFSAATGLPCQAFLIYTQPPRVLAVN